jgi:2-C-methyl-D-erythritol 4-phosphate cytidylyltransferase
LADTEKYAIILAGGTGLRMGKAVPKQFLLLQGKPLIWYSLESFLKAYTDLEIILVLPDGYHQTGKGIVESTSAPDRIRIINGGATRFYSVKNGLEFVQRPSIVFIHDGVRCLLSTSLIHRCYNMALVNGNAIPAIGAIDSMRLVTDKGSEILDRSKVRFLQTPQTFRSEIVKTAYQQDYSELFTDDASVVEQLGVAIQLVEGEEENVKMTRPIDLLIMEQILENRSLQKQG